MINHTRWIVGSKRPTKTPDGLPIPDNWIIYNAPRPLKGHLTWVGDCISGVFYAIAPASDVLTYQVNIALDAHVLKWATQEDIDNFVKTVLVAEFPEMARHLGNKEYQQYFEDKFWLYYNFGDI